MYEPVHGSARDIAGRGWANPADALLCGAQLLADLGDDGSADDLHAAVAEALTDPSNHGPDVGGTARTTRMASAVLHRMETL